MLGSSSEGENVIEENTHIAYLCDLLERIWGHGLKKRDVCTPLLMFVTIYRTRTYYVLIFTIVCYYI